MHQIKSRTTDPTHRTSAKLSLAVCLGLLCLLTACNDFFGKKTSKDFLPITNNVNTTVSYAQVFPNLVPMGGQSWNPVNICMGFDNLIYVVDSAKGIYCFNEAGVEQSYLPLPGVTYVTQDRRLDLLAITKDTATIIQGAPVQRTSIINRINIKTTNPNNTYTIGLSVFNGLSAAEKAARIKRIVFPLFLGQTGRNTALANINLNAIAVLGDNDYYVTCSSNIKSNESDDFNNNGVLLCTDPDNEARVRAWTPVNIVGAGGTNFNYFSQPFAITTLAQPPNSVNLIGARSRDFIFSSLDDQELVKVRYISQNTSGEIPFYQDKDRPTSVPTGTADGVLYQLGRFRGPRGLTVAGDNSRYLFVVDKDSIYQFTLDGLEGVPPTAASSSRKLIKVSTGGKICGVADNGATSCADLLVRPISVGYDNRLVYVVDGSLKKVLRFRLTTDFQ